MTQAYTREDVARAVAQEFKVPKRQGQAVVNFVIENILQAVKEGRKVNIPPMGSFQLVQKPPRRGLNPKTKKIERFPERQSIRFRSSAKAGV